MRPLSIVLVTTASLTFAGSALACNDHAPGEEPKTPAAARESGWIKGQVRDVDSEEGTITLAHEKIDALHMKPMSSMVIKAEKTSLIEGARLGDKVKFRVRVMNGHPVLTRLVVAAN